MITISSDLKTYSQIFKDNELLLPQKEIFQEIHEVLANIISEKHAIAIPLYYFYTSQIITPQKLKDYDINLLKGLLKDGEYKIAIEPIELTTYYDEQDSDSEENKTVDVDLHAFPWTLYSIDPQSEELSKSVLEEWHRDTSLTYVYTGRESLVSFHNKPYIQCTGNEPQSAENHYLCGALIVMKA